MPPQVRFLLCNSREITAKTVKAQHLKLLVATLCHYALPLLISDIRALWRSALSARVPECQKLKVVG